MEYYLYDTLYSNASRMKVENARISEIFAIPRTHITTWSFRFSLSFGIQMIKMKVEILPYTGSHLFGTTSVRNPSKLTKPAIALIADTPSEETEKKYQNIFCQCMSWSLSVAESKNNYCNRAIKGASNYLQLFPKSCCHSPEFPQANDHFVGITFVIAISPVPADRHSENVCPISLYFGP